MYSMKQTCEKVGMSYQTLKFYCNQGLIPNVQRDKNNYRIYFVQSYYHAEYTLSANLTISYFEDYQAIILFLIQCRSGYIKNQ